MELQVRVLPGAPISRGQPIHLYDRGSRGAIAYIGLAGEIIRRDRARTQGPGDAAGVDTAASHADDAAPTTP